MFSDLVPRTGFLPSYFLAARRLCDAPLLYHLGSILPVLSAVVCPSCIGVASGSGGKMKEPLFLWVMLLGESGSRKTQAFLKAKALGVFDAQNPGCGPGPLASRARTAMGSRAGLEAMLELEPNAFVTIEELAPWIRSHRAAYAQDGAQTWCEIFDGRLDRSNLRKNAEENAQAAKDKAKVRRPAQKDEKPVRVSFLATGATPSVMSATRAQPQIWDSGLFARVVVLSTDPPDDRPGPYAWSPGALDDLRSDLVEVGELATRIGTVTVDDDAKRLWDGWLLDRGSRNRGLCETHAILLRRLPSFAFRIGCLYALSRGSSRTSLDDMTRALRLADVSVDCVLSLDLR